MKRATGLWLIGLLLSSLAACLSNWEGGTPCRTDNHCSEGYICMTDGGCGVGERTTDAGPNTDAGI